jgi:hypothetical protein
MATLSSPIDAWTDATIQQLVADQQAETITVEFKRDLPHSSPSDRREVGKDVSAMANSSGGWIVYGVDEKPGQAGIKVASAVTPLTGPPNAGHWIDDVVAGQVTPRPSFRVREIPTPAGVVVVVRVTPSSDDLHMLSDNRFYRRSEQGARPMSEPEIRQAYALLSQRRTESKRFVDEIVADEMVGPPSQGFLLALVPHTLREVVDPARFRFDTPYFKPLPFEYSRELGPYEKGCQSLIADGYRFRYRRDGSISLAFPGFSERGWFPFMVLEELVTLLAIARLAWPAAGVVESATLAMRARLPPGLATIEGDVFRREKPILGSSLIVDLPVRSDLLHDGCLGLIRLALDRIYQTMGTTHSPFFEDSGGLRPRVKNELSSLFSRLGGEPTWLRA